MKIPVEAARDICDKYNLDQVMIVGWDGEQVQTATWGIGRKTCAQVAQLRDRFMAFLGCKERL